MDKQINHLGHPILWGPNNHTTASLMPFFFYYFFEIVTSFQIQTGRKFFSESLSKIFNIHYLSCANKIRKSCLLSLYYMYLKKFCHFFFLRHNKAKAIYFALDYFHLAIFYTINWKMWWKLLWIQITKTLFLQISIPQPLSSDKVNHLSKFWRLSLCYKINFHWMFWFGPYISA